MRDVEVEPRPGWETGEISAEKWGECEEENHKLGLPTTALFEKRFCDYVVVSLSHKQQTKSHNIYIFFFKPVSQRVLRRRHD